MILTCPDCDLTYDDAERLTYCPHERIMAVADMEQKKAALALIGKAICFAHANSMTYRVQSVGWNGMVTLYGMTGEFAPHLFVLAGTGNACSD